MNIPRFPHVFARATLLALLPFNPACSTAPGHHYRVRSGTTLVESLGDDHVQVAALVDGELLGADAVWRERFTLGEWLHGREIVDHAKLEVWRGQLRSLRELSAESAATSAEILAAARGFPFEEVVDSALDGWVRDDAIRAGEVLDEVADLDLRDITAERIARVAAGGAGVEDRRAARWLRDLIEEDHGAAGFALLASPTCGPRTSDAALSQLDQFPRALRRSVFELASVRIANDPGGPSTIIAAVDELANSDEAPALLHVLGHTTSLELGRLVLLELDERRSADRAELFARVVSAGCGDPAAGATIVRAIDELPRRDRFAAARLVVQHPSASEQLTVALLEKIETLPPGDRAALIEPLIDSGRAAASAELRRACQRAARAVSPRAERERVLQRLQD